jgi:uncharacterized protein YjlB
VLPAGTGGQGLWASADLVLIGAYPPAGNTTFAAAARPSMRARAAIPPVPLPASDPVRGKSGLLMKLWKA